MTKIGILIPHYCTAKLTAVCVYFYKLFGTSVVDSEIVVCNNSIEHPSIRVLTETCLGDGVKIVQGNPEFRSHGLGYWKAYQLTDADWIFTSETDSFPIRHGWFDEYLKASVDCDFMGPDTPMGGGHYLHPAGAMVHRRVIEAAQRWQEAHRQWLFVPGAGAKLKTSDRGYHVVAHEDWLGDLPLVDEAMHHEIALWRDVGVWQEMRSFDEDSFDNYWERREILNWEPVAGKFAYNKIGYEPGQHLSYFAQKNFRVKRLPRQIIWMNGMEGRQAAYTDIMGGFRHLWAGTVTKVSAKDMDPRVVSLKQSQVDEFFNQLPEDIRSKVLQIESECP